MIFAFQGGTSLDIFALQLSGVANMLKSLAPITFLPISICKACHLVEQTIEFLNDEDKKDRVGSTCEICIPHVSIASSLDCRVYIKHEQRGQGLDFCRKESYVCLFFFFGVL